jgi:hypothetical protein
MIKLTEDQVEYLALFNRKKELLNSLKHIQKEIGAVHAMLVSAESKLTPAERVDAFRISVSEQ